MGGGPYKGDPAQMLKAHIRPGDVVVDVGASSGRMTVFFAELVGEQGRVYAFEPDPRHDTDWRRHPAASRILWHPVAVSNSGGERQFTQGRGGEQSSLFAGAVEDAIGSLPIATVRLDDVVPRMDVLKIDAQGGDVDVLKSAACLLQSCRVVAVECWPHGLEKAGTTAEALLDLLRAAGFDMRWSNEDVITDAGWKTWRAACAERSFLNLLAVRVA